MKIISKLFMIVALMFALTGCHDDETFDDILANGALVNADGAVSIALGANVSFEVDIQQNNTGDVASVEMFKQLISSKGTSGVIDYTSVNTFPTQIDQSIGETLRNFTVAGAAFSEADLAAGDQIEVTYKITMSDGRVLTSLATTDINFTD